MHPNGHLLMTANWTYTTKRWITLEILTPRGTCAATRRFNHHVRWLPLGNLEIQRGGLRRRIWYDTWPWYQSHTTYATFHIHDSIRLIHWIAYEKIVRKVIILLMAMTYRSKHDHAMNTTEQSTMLDERWTNAPKKTLWSHRERDGHCTISQETLIDRSRDLVTHMPIVFQCKKLLNFSPTAPDCLGYSTNQNPPLLPAIPPLRLRNGLLPCCSCMDGFCYRSSNFWEFCSAISPRLLVYLATDDLAYSQAPI